MERVKLMFWQATEVVGDSNDGLLLLTDVQRERQIAIPCNKKIIGEMAARMDPKANHDRELPEVLMKVLRWQADVQLELVIDGVTNGEYHAVLSNRSTLTQLPVNAADAVLLNFISKDSIPLYIDSILFGRQSTRYNAKSHGVALPVNSLSDNMLKEALDKAIRNENYELASQLRDEMKRRKPKANEGSHGVEEGE